jgi:tetratricopeptide (TPR) repeat protein
MQKKDMITSGGVVMISPLPRLSAPLFFVFVLTLFTEVGSTIVLADSRSDCRSGDFDRMIKSCAELAQNPKTPKAERVEYFVRLGAAKFARNDLVAARSAYASAIRLDSGYAIAHLNLADLELNAGNLKQAIDSYNKAIENYSKALQSDSANASEGLVSSFIGRGNAYFETGKFDVAISEYNEALKHKPDSSAALLCTWNCRSPAPRASRRRQVGSPTERSPPQRWHV